jgi:PAS domain S-box-containing protein
MLPVGLEAALSELGDETRPAAAIAMDGRYLDANRSFLDLVGLTIDELRTHEVGDFTPVEHRSAALERWRGWADSDRDDLTVEATIRAANGLSVRVLATISRVSPDTCIGTISPLDDGAELPRIDRNASKVLAEWREVERERDASAHASPRWLEAKARADQLQREYAEIFERERSKEVDH